jgi:uncharacterized membrane protein
MSISKYYRWLSLVTLAFSVVGPMVLSNGSIGENLWIGLLMNGQFHLAYYSLSGLAFEMFKKFQSQSSLKVWVRKIFIGISIFMMIAPIIPLIELVKSSINDHKYEQLLVSMTFVGLFLGSYSLKLKVKSATA